MANKWIEHVKAYAKNNNVNYSTALKDPKCKNSYKKMTGGNIKEFKKHLENSYKNPDDQAEQIGDYIRDNSLSGKRVQVYHNPQTGKTKMNIRGTHSSKDILNDALLSMNMLNTTDRFKHAKSIKKKAIDKYGTDIEFQGHSLGSAIADRLAGDKYTSRTFNKPVTFYDVVKRGRANHESYRTEGDPISILQQFQKGKKPKIIKSLSYNPLYNHSLKSLK